MTGIFLYYNKTEEKKPDFLALCAKTIDHRGGNRGSFINENNFFAYITFNQAEAQNMDYLEVIHDDNNNFIGLDGQIFNIDQITAQILNKKPELGQKFNPLYQGYILFGKSFFKMLEGIFSLVIKKGSQILAIKDPVGSKPLYIIDTSKYLAISSELKALTQFPESPAYLQPGEIFNFDGFASKYEKFASVDELNQLPLKTEADIVEIKTKLWQLVHQAVKNAIKIRGKISSLLSGGIDSTIIAAVAMQYVPNLDVYTVAVENSQDLKYAKMFAEINREKVNHHIYEFNLDDMLKILPKVIYHLETFDAALIRSAIPMYYLASKIDPSTSVLLTGEGGDELFGGYEYLKDLDENALKKELNDMLLIEHATGLQRVDRIPYAFGIEARAPWFDYPIVKYSFQIPSSMKLKKDGDNIMEKWIIRETFKNDLPEELVWRKKAKFSQGVGSEFLMRDYINGKISDAEFSTESEIVPKIYVKSKEELFYWRIFKDFFNPKEKFIQELPRTSNFVL